MTILRGRRVFPLAPASWADALPLLRLLLLPDGASTVFSALATNSINEIGAESPRRWPIFDDPGIAARTILEARRDGVEQLPHDRFNHERFPGLDAWVQAARVCPT